MSVLMQSEPAESRASAAPQTLGRGRGGQGHILSSRMEAAISANPDQWVAPHLGPQGPPSVTTGHLDSWVPVTGHQLPPAPPSLPAWPAMWHNVS